MSNRTLTTPEELADFCIGKQLYRDHRMVEACTTQAQRMGWYKAMNATLNILCLDWNSFSLEPKQAIKFSDSSLSEAAKRNIYDFPELVQENPLF